MIEPIEKAITNSDVGFTPVNDGKLIRLTLPEMSTARRDDLVKLFIRKLMKAKNAFAMCAKILIIPCAIIKKIKKYLKISLVVLKMCLQKVTDKFIAQLDQLMQKKEKDIKTV